jgi:hypothetical protein
MKVRAALTISLTEIPPQALAIIKLLPTKARYGKMLLSRIAHIGKP